MGPGVSSATRNGFPVFEFPSPVLHAATHSVAKMWKNATVKRNGRIYQYVSHETTDTYSNVNNISPNISLCVLVEIATRLSEYEIEDSLKIVRAVEGDA